MSNLPKRTHKAAIAAIKELVGKMGGYVYVSHQGYGHGRTGALWGTAGIPDLFCMVRGQAFWVEVKVGRDKMRPAQAAFKELSEQHGVPVVVGDVDVVIEFLS